MSNISKKKWFVLYTKPRNELKVSERLLSMEIEVYAPTKVEVRQWSDRKKKVITPLLPSIVLVRLNEKNVADVFDVSGVVRYLFENGKRAIVLDEEVIAMKTYLDHSFKINEKKITVGDTIKVPLLQQEAKLISIKGKKCIARLKKLGVIVSFQLN